MRECCAKQRQNTTDTDHLHPLASPQFGSQLKEGTLDNWIITFLEMDKSSALVPTILIRIAFLVAVAAERVVERER